MELKQGITILRIFDADKAREFYSDYLGFTVDWGIALKTTCLCTCKYLEAHAYYIFRSTMGTEHLEQKLELSVQMLMRCTRS